MKKFYLLALTSLFLSACGATGSHFTEMTPPAEGKGKIYVYRPSSMFGGGVHYNVHANDALIGDIRNGGYLSAELEPGNYEVWGKTEARRSVTIPLRANEIQCVKAGVGMGAFVGRPKLNHVSIDQCRSEIIGTQQSF